MKGRTYPIRNTTVNRPDTAIRHSFFLHTADVSKLVFRQENSISSICEVT